MFCCKRHTNVYPDEQSQHQERVKAKEPIPPLLSCQELKALLRMPTNEVSVLEADIGKQSEAAFQSGHIPKARYFDQLECTTPTTYIPRGLPDIKCFENYLTHLGVSNTDHIVLYDRSPNGFVASGRAWLLLKAYGINNLSILNGGFNGWVKRINEIESSTSIDSKNEKKKFTVHFNEKMVRTFDQMLVNFSTSVDNTQRIQVVDARPPNLFYGMDAGHMPGALNIPHASLLDQENQCLKSKDELLEIFKKVGVDLSKPTIYTCHTGTTASTLAFVAHILGQKELSVYIGAFTEWQQRAPEEMIIKGDGPVATN